MPVGNLGGVAYRQPEFCRYVLAVSADLWAILLLPLLFAIALWWPKRHGAVVEDSRVGLTRLFMALHIDMFVILLGGLPAVFIPALVMEYIATGVWQWSFEREVFMPRDWVSLVIGLASCFGGYYYFKWHFDRGAQTFGQHLLRFKVLPSRDHPSFGSRTFVAWLSLSWWPFWPWTLFRKRQDYMWDTTSGTKARRVAVS